MGRLNVIMKDLTPFTPPSRYKPTHSTFIPAIPTSSTPTTSITSTPGSPTCR